MQKLDEIISLIFGVGGDALSDEATPSQIPGWDSITHIVLLMSIEEQMGVKFSEVEMTGVHSIGDIRQLVAQKVT